MDQILLNEHDLKEYRIVTGEAAEVGWSYVAIDVSGKPAWIRIVGAGSGEDSLAMLNRDLEVAAGLHHPNLVKLVKYGIFDRDVVAVYEFVPCVSLREFATQANVVVRQEMVERVAPPLIVGVNAMHEKKIAHWGIGPSNVLITPTGVKIADVGLAATYRDHVKNATLHSLAAPELTRGEPQIGSDYYSVSTTLIEVAGDLANEIMRTAVRLPGLGVLSAVGEMFEFVKDVHKRGGTFKKLSKPLGHILERFLSVDPAQRKMTDDDIRLIQEAYSRVQQPTTPRIPVQDEISRPQAHETLSTELRRWQEWTRIEAKRRIIADAVVKTIATSESKETIATGPAEGRFVNVWTNAGTPTMEVSERWYDLSMQIATTADQRTAAPFVEPNLEENASTNLLVSFYSDDLEIETHQRTVSLPAAGSSEIATTKIRPRHAGICKVEIMISLARELEILQVLEVEITAEVTAAEVVPAAV